MASFAGLRAELERIIAASSLQPYDGHWRAVRIGLFGSRYSEISTAPTLLNRLAAMSFGTAQALRTNQAISRFSAARRGTAWPGRLRQVSPARRLRRPPWGGSIRPPIEQPKRHVTKQRGN